MQAPGPNVLRFVHGVRTAGFLAYVGALWREHGDVFQVRLGSRVMMFAMHSDAVERINVSGRQRYDKRASYDGVREFLLGDGLVASTGELWKRQRKLMAPFFTPKASLAYADLMLQDAARLQERWTELAARKATVEIAEEMTSVTASIILRAMFSTQTIESIEKMKSAVETLIAFTSERLASVPVPLWVPTEKNKRYLEARAMVNRSITELIAARRRMRPEEQPSDLLSRLMNARDEETGQSMSESLLRDESITTFFAGHETTARTMTFAWYALASNPDVLAKLQDELDRVLGDRAPTTDDLRQLPYTLQVIKEVLRLYPPAPFYVRDAIEPDTIGGFDVPVGASVMLSPYFTHRHPAFWSEPERFDPDRWSKEREASQHSHQYHPFAAGPRICIGNNFSLLESHLLLAVLAQRFVPKLVPGYVAEWEMKGVLGLARGLPMRIEQRAPRAVAHAPTAAE